MRRTPPQAADLLLEPVVLLALATLVINDHVLKGVGPAPLTGILSGIAGLVLVPAVLVACHELVIALRGRWMAPSMVPMLGACLAVATAYGAVELLPAATDIYRWTWGVLQWPAATLLALAGGQAPPALVPVRAVADPFDLLALPVLAIPLVLQARRTSVPAGRFTTA